MEQADAAGREAGVRLLDVGPGRARTALTVAARHLNGHGICHGGYVFLPADAAFAYAANSYAGPAAVERARSGRSGLYDVSVRVADEVVAEFRGRARQVPGLPGPGA